MKKAIYIGAGEDTEPYVRLSNVQHFVCIDSLPYSSTGRFIFENHTRDGFEWVVEFAKKMALIGFVIDQKRMKRTYPILAFSNRTTGQTVNYYPMTVFPAMVFPALTEDLSGASVLICRGHMPDSKVVDYMTEKYDMIVSRTTWYEDDEWDCFKPKQIIDLETGRELPVRLNQVNQYYRYKEFLRDDLKR